MNEKAAQFRSIKRKGNFESKRLAVLREAARHFAAKGVNQTSLEDIAKQLKITKPALYYYVKNKEEIISECLAIAHEDDAREIARIGLMEVDGWSKYRALMHYYARLVVSDFGKCLVLVDLNALSPAGRKMHRESQRHLLAGTRDFYRSGIKDGSIRPSDPKVMTFAIVGALNSLAYWYDAEGDQDLESIVDQIIGVFEESLHQA